VGQDRSPWGRTGARGAGQEPVGQDRSRFIDDRQIINT